MTVKPFLVITAVLGLLFGLGFVLLPAPVLSTFGITADQALQHMARNFGSALLAIGAMSWAARNAADSVAKRAIILALFIYFTLGSISILLFQLTGIPNNSAWFNFAFHLPLALVFGYFVFFSRGKVES
jgi:hypothetical protein